MPTATKTTLSKKTAQKNGHKKNAPGTSEKPALTSLETAVIGSTALRARTRAIYLLAVRSFLTFVARSTRSAHVSHAQGGGVRARKPGASDWTAQAVQRWIKSLLRQGLAPQTVNLQLRGLRSASQRRAKLASSGGLGESAGTAIDFASTVAGLPPGAPGTRVPLSVAQARALVKACSGARPIDLRDRALIVLGLRTGMRRSALCGIFMHDLTGLPGKANGGGTVATKAVPRHARLTIHLKGGRQWTLSLDKETVDALLPWIDWL